MDPDPESDPDPAFSISNFNPWQPDSRIPGVYTMAIDYIPCQFESDKIIYAWGGTKHEGGTDPEGLYCFSQADIMVMMKQIT